MGFHGFFMIFSRFLKATSGSRTPRRHIPEQEIVLAAMPLSAELRRATKLRLAIHPQFEAQHLRDRVQELYQFYQCTEPGSFVETMKKYQSKYLVLEFKRCRSLPQETSFSRLIE